MKKMFSVKALLKLVVFVLIVGLGFTAAYFYQQYSLIKKNPGILAQQETQKITDRLGKVIDIPNDEVPSLATITDISKLQDQPFFAKAKNGDMLLVWSKAKKAILYRPSENKIIDFTLVDSGASGVSPAPSPVSQVAKVGIYNGTSVAGLSEKASQKLTTIYPEFGVVLKENASKSTYTKTLVVDLSKSHGETASLIASALNGEVGGLPEGEKPPATGNSVDILVILGSDFNK